jgi:hypothetical protein
MCWGKYGKQEKAFLMTKHRGEWTEQCTAKEKQSENNYRD